ncbi:hypothetical protein [Leuconostoc mesenteroides]|uniref:hypothetical protein n=1 Tax=Leuconostoc mesenteroides TaxID=1245 RepID=UPI0021A67C9B|nr:hypothetical protein [Leuconostoc mesenteroides]MCT3046730.1 hypothetical protein [Leuconostoc mesenteroides]
MKKIIGIIFAVIILIFIGVKAVNEPHSMTTQQVLEKYNWELQSTSNNKTLGTVHFSKNTLTIVKGGKITKNAYILDDNDHLKINSGNYANTYSIDMDSTDYTLSPVTDNTKEKLKLIRN